jgi:hypothetical protein
LNKYCTKRLPDSVIQAGLPDCVIKAGRLLRRFFLPQPSPRRRTETLFLALLKGYNLRNGPTVISLRCDKLCFCATTRRGLWQCRRSEACPTESSRRDYRLLRRFFLPQPSPRRRTETLFLALLKGYNLRNGPRVISLRCDKLCFCATTRRGLWQCRRSEACPTESFRRACPIVIQAGLPDRVIQAGR